MISKKMVAGVLIIGVMTSSGAVLARGDSKDEGEKKITVMNYQSAEKINRDGVKAEKLKKTEAFGWVSENEMLTLERREAGDFKSWEYTYDYSFMNESNGEKKQVKNDSLKMNSILDISPSKENAVVKGPKFIPENEEDWKKEHESGKLSHEDVFILNLKTGKYQELKTRYNNHEASYKWIDDKKILVFYTGLKEWNIIDVNGSVLNQGKINCKESVHFIGADLKAEGSEVSGSIFICESYTGSERRVVYKADAKSKTVKPIIDSKRAVFCMSANNMIFTSDVQGNNSKVTLYDENGTKKKEFAVKGKADMDVSKLSPDGTKLAIRNGLGGWSQSLQILDAGTGEVKDIITAGHISNMNWNSISTELSFISQDSSFDEIGDTYKISFNK